MKTSQGIENFKF